MLVVSNTSAVVVQSHAATIFTVSFSNKEPELHVQVQRVGQSAYYFGVAKGDRRTGEGKYLGLPQGIYG